MPEQQEPHARGVLPFFSDLLELEQENWREGGDGCRDLERQNPERRFRGLREPVDREERHGKEEESMKPMFPRIAARIAFFPREDRI